MFKWLKGIIKRSRRTFAQDRLVSNRLRIKEN